MTDGRAIREEQRLPSSPPPPPPPLPLIYDEVTSDTRDAEMRLRSTCVHLQESSGWGLI